MVLMSLRKKLQLNAVYDGEVFCGMVCYYISDNTVYLAYLAVEPELRGNGYGSRILHMLEEKYPDQQIVLDIEPLDPDAENYHQRVVVCVFTRRMVGVERTRCWLTRMVNLKP